MSAPAPPFQPGPGTPFEPGVDAVVGLGSNIGDRWGSLRFAVGRLAELGQVVAVSAVYQTLPVGPPQPDYLNAAVRLLSPLEPLPLLRALLEIERGAGRERRERWGPRCLDLDLLWILNRSLETPDLVVPHPELSQRAFAIAPLLDVAPGAFDPRTGVRYAELLGRLDASGIQRVASASELLLARP